MIRNDFQPRGHILENNGVDGEAELLADHAQGSACTRKSSSQHQTDAALADMSNSTTAASSEASTKDAGQITSTATPNTDLPPVRASWLTNLDDKQHYERLRDDVVKVPFVDTALSRAIRS